MESNICKRMDDFIKDFELENESKFSAAFFRVDITNLRNLYSISPKDSKNDKTIFSVKKNADGSYVLSTDEVTDKKKNIEISDVSHVFVYCGKNDNDNGDTNIIAVHKNASGKCILYLLSDITK